MPHPIPFQRRLPPHLVAPPRRPRETDEQRRDRQLDLTGELTDLNMIAARDAADRIVTRDRDAPDPAPATQDPTLALARATRSVTIVINLENRIAGGERAAVPFSIEDPRALGLRKLLHPLVDREPDPVRRRAMRTRINDRIEDALGVDLDDDLPLAQIAGVIAAEHGLTLDLAKVADEYLYPPSSPAPDWRHEARMRDHR